MTDLVDALWVAGFTAELPDKTQLVPGQTVARIPRGEALGSDHWQVKDVTADDLRDEADKLGIDVPSNARKADVEKLIAEHNAPAKPKAKE